MLRNLFVACLALIGTVALAVLIVLFAYAYFKQPGTAYVPSPLAQSKQLAPVSGNMFAGRIKPVGELIARQEMQRYVALPGSPDGMDGIEANLANFRDYKLKTPSGLWKMTVIYTLFRDQYRHAYSNPDSKAEFDKVFDAWVTTRPPSPTPYILKAHILNGLFRDADEALAQSSTPLPAQVVAAELRETELTAFLDASKAVASADPSWYLLKMAALKQRCRPFESIWKVAEEGSQKFPDFYQIYFDVMAAGVKCGAAEPGVIIQRVVDLATARTNTAEGDSAYARMFWVVAQYFGDPLAFNSGLIDWPRMKRGIDDVLKTHPDAWNINNFARIACLMQDGPKARELLAKALDLPVMVVWGDVGNFEACWKAANTSAQFGGERVQ